MIVGVVMKWNKFFDQSSSMIYLLALTIVMKLTGVQFKLFYKETWDYTAWKRQ